MCGSWSLSGLRLSGLSLSILYWWKQCKHPGGRYSKDRVGGICRLCFKLKLTSKICSHNVLIKVFLEKIEGRNRHKISSNAKKDPGLISAKEFCSGTFLERPSSPLPVHTALKVSWVMLHYLRPAFLWPRWNMTGATGSSLIKQRVLKAQGAGERVMGPPGETQIATHVSP